MKKLPQLSLKKHSTWRRHFFSCKKHGFRHVWISEAGSSSPLWLSLLLREFTVQRIFIFVVGKRESIIFSEKVLYFWREYYIFGESIIFLEKVLYFWRKYYISGESIIFLKKVFIFFESNKYRFGVPYQSRSQSALFTTESNQNIRLFN